MCHHAQTAICTALPQPEADLGIELGPRQHADDAVLREWTSGILQSPPALMQNLCVPNPNSDPDPDPDNALQCSPSSRQQALRCTRTMPTATAARSRSGRRTGATFTAIHTWCKPRLRSSLHLLSERQRAAHFRTVLPAVRCHHRRCNVYGGVPMRVAFTFVPSNGSNMTHVDQCALQRRSYLWGLSPGLEHGSQSSCSLHVSGLSVSHWWYARVIRVKTPRRAGSGSGLSDPCAKRNLSPGPGG